jgi:hypothetical protein
MPSALLTGRSGVAPRLPWEQVTGVRLPLSRRRKTQGTLILPASLGTGSGMYTSRRGRSPGLAVAWQ